jgi:hypothetical protein
MTKGQVERLAKHDRTYRAGRLKGQCASEHVVEFDTVPEVEPLRSLAMGAKRGNFDISGRGL